MTLAAVWHWSLHRHRIGSKVDFPPGRHCIGRLGEDGPPIRRSTDCQAEGGADSPPTLLLPLSMSGEVEPRETCGNITQSAAQIS